MKQSSVRARIRQLCCLGIPGELLMGSLLPLLRELVPSDSAFFWVDSRGDMQNLYADLPRRCALLERYYEGARASFRRVWARAAAPDGGGDERRRRAEQDLLQRS